jgi:ribosomal protein L11 methyltransferase
MKQWLEISLSVPSESGEAISNFLSERGTTGIEEVDEGPGWKRLKAYFPADGKKSSLLQALKRYLKSLEKIYPDIARSRTEIQRIPEQDWSENWKKFFKPLQVTPRFLVRAPWSSVRPKKGVVQIVITPGMAFGIGTHATTRLCIQALEKRLPKGGAAVLDVGTGTGILAILAAKAGAKEAWGIDIDPLAVEAAGENVTLNAVSDVVRIRQGSVGRIRKRFEVVAANIDFRSLRRISAPLARRVKTGGCLILSGILNQDEASLRRLYQETHVLKWLETVREGEWSCLTFRRRKD